MAKDKQDEIFEVVLFLKEQIVNNHTELIAKLDGVNRRIDNEVDQRKTIDVRVNKLEEKVFGNV